MKTRKQITEDAKQAKLEVVKRQAEELNELERYEYPQGRFGLGIQKNKHYLYLQKITYQASPRGAQVHQPIIHQSICTLLKVAIEEAPEINPQNYFWGKLNYYKSKEKLFKAAKRKGIAESALLMFNNHLLDLKDKV